MVISRTGARVKRFLMSGKMNTLAGLHRAIKAFLMTRVRNGSRKAEDTITSPVCAKHGIINISDDSAYSYSNSILKFAEGMRVLVQQTFFRAGGGNIVNYLALVLTKLKTEKARKRARSGEDYFNTKLPVSCIKN